ncbi:peptidase M20 [Salinigranum rubrum]|uniref:Peptidase M20 n=1 Tax=Salinigranum rubrum TaxID=755307 RepID=A0A2I8VN45_9EURY|nr:M20/M25/M40 family metallo-hydrolase [Salinigranum rubrum]AUV83346.1 peptidase M20 [Salinigranum rubrum]
MQFRAFDDDLRRFTEEFLRFETTDRNEKPAQEWLESRFEELGFETFRWEADADRLAEHPSFPDASELVTAERPSVAGVLEFGDPDAGPTLVLNGHADVVPADEGVWTSEPFEPTWDEEGEELTARGVVDMKTAVGVCAFAALTAHETFGDGVDGRVVVECVAGEEEGGIGAAAAALDNPYPFERDAAIVAEPTDLSPVVATEGCLMKRLELTGRSAHAARRWEGVDVLDKFETIRHRFLDLESERGERVTHPLYADFDNPWPLTIGVVEAGSWASTVAASLTAECRFGVAPGESVDDAEAEYERALQEVVDDDPWLSEHPPTFDRFTIQFEPAETDVDEPVVEAVQAAMRAHGRTETDPLGETYGADNRHYVAAGIPTVVFGPGRIEQAHFPDETLVWEDALVAGEVLVDAVEAFLSGDA